jgi:hypothetical protein
MKLKSLNKTLLSYILDELVAKSSTDVKSVGAMPHATSARGKGYKMEFMYK